MIEFAHSISLNMLSACDLWYTNSGSRKLLVLKSHHVKIWPANGRRFFRSSPLRNVSRGGTKRNVPKRPSAKMSEEKRLPAGFLKTEGVYKETKRRGYLLLMSPRCNCTGQGKL